MSSVSQNPLSISSTPEFIALASAIDGSVSSDRAADLLANFYNTVERKVRAEVRREDATALRDGNTNWTDDTASVVVDEVADWLERRADGAA